MPPLQPRLAQANLIKSAVTSSSSRSVRTAGNAGATQCLRRCHAEAAVSSRWSSLALPAARQSTSASGHPFVAGQARRSLATAAATSPPQPLVHDTFDPKTGSWQYIVADPATQKAVIIDPVLEYDAASATISTQPADDMLKYVGELGYQIEMILETHAHADHLTAASYLRDKLARTQGYAPTIGIGRRIKHVQEMFMERYRMGPELFEGGFDKYFDDDETFQFGSLTGQAIHLPGHTPDHMGYKIGDNVFVGDSIFPADLGSARADFPGGSAETLYASGRKLLSMPEHVTIYVGHDYPPQGRDRPVSGTTVGEHRRRNKHLNDDMKEQEFVQMRKERDKTLTEPKLLHQSLQLNLRAGRLPETSDGGFRLIATPLKLKNAEW